MRNPAKYLPRFLCAAALVLVAAAALTYAVDPLQLFRPARLFAAMYSQDPRMQNAGLIRSQQFDTVLMGTSLSIHFRQSDIDRMLGVRSLKLSMTGSNSVQQSFVIAAALERQRCPFAPVDEPPTLPSDPTKAARRIGRVHEHARSRCDQDADHRRIDVGGQLDHAAQYEGRVRL